MPEQPFVPPPRKPVSEFPTPDPSVAFYTELVNRDDPAYKANAPMKRGALYSTIVGAKQEVIAQYPQLFFLRERKFQLNDQLVLWDWATDEQAHDTYNSTDTYVQNSVNYPAFTRTYTVRRELYEAEPVVPIGSPLPGIIAVTVTSPGEGYTKATGVIDGTSVAITFTISPNGGLLNGIITNTGGEDLVPNGTPISIIGDGINASAIAVSQPTGCVLTAQTKKEQDDSDPIQHELVEVIRVYETLPGPWIYTTRQDKDGAIVTSKTRRQIKQLITDGDEILGDEWIQTWHKDVDDFIAEETVESRPIPGNLIISTKVDQDGKILTTNRRLIDTTLGVSSETLVDGVWTKNYVTEVDDSSLVKVHQASTKVSYQVSEGRDVPGNPMVTTRLDDDGIEVDITKILKDSSTIVTEEKLVPTNGSSRWIRTHKEEVSDLVAWEITEERVVPGNVIQSTRVDDDGIEVDVRKVLRALSTITTQETLAGGIWTKRHAEAVTELVGWEVTEVRAIPGNVMTTTRLDEDGVEVDVRRTMSKATDITTSEALQPVNGSFSWVRTHAEAISDLVAWQVVETRAIPGNVISESKLDEAGNKVFTFRQMVPALDVDTSETVSVTHVWLKKYGTPITELVSWQIQEQIQLPGNVQTSTKIDEDGVVIYVFKRLEEIALITPSESISGGGVWIRLFYEQLSDLVATEVQEQRSLPGNPIFEVSIDKDGKEIEVVRTLKETTTILTGESTVGGVWARTDYDRLTDLVSWEKVTARLIPGNIIPSANIGSDHEISTVSTVLKDKNLITPSASEAGGFITTVEQREVSDLVSDQITTVKEWLDTASYSISVENLIPAEFRAFIPTFVESHILAGTASMPTLGVGEFERTERQITKLLFERRVTSLGSISLPITHQNKELTEEFGGGVLNINLTLDATGVQTIDEGLLVVRSSLRVLGNGMDLKETAVLDDTAWPVISSRLWDENMRLEYDETSQVVIAGASEDPDPGGATFAWVSEVKGIDKWRSRKINTSKPTPLYTDESSAIISYSYKPYRFPGLLYFSGFGYYVRAADATLVQHKIKTWWVKSVSPPPTPAIDDIILDNVIINNPNNNGLTYSGPVLHDDYTIGALFYPATTPSYTEYALGTPGPPTLQNIATLYSPGSTGGYMVGDIVFINSGGNSMSINVTFVYDVPSGPTGLIGGWTNNPGGNYPPGTYNFIAATGGSGSGAIFNVFAAEIPSYTPPGWIGTYRVIGASVTPEKEKDVWKYQTESVVMR